VKNVEKPILDLPANAYWTVSTRKVCFTRSREEREERQKWGENIQSAEELTGFLVLRFFSYSIFKKLSGFRLKGAAGMTECGDSL
jgi:hypothetical protein